MQYRAIFLHGWRVLGAREDAHKLAVARFDRAPHVGMLLYARKCRHRSAVGVDPFSRRAHLGNQGVGAAKNMT